MRCQVDFTDRLIIFSVLFNDLSEFDSDLRCKDQFDESIRLQSFIVAQKPKATLVVNRPRKPNRLLEVIESGAKLAS